MLMNDIKIFHVDANLYVNVSSRKILGFENVVVLSINMLFFIGIPNVELIILRPVSIH